jgi:hypothetical protein
MHFCDFAIAQPSRDLLETANAVGNFLCCSLIVGQEFAVDMFFADIDTENRHHFLKATAPISLTHSSSSRKARPTIPSDLFCRKMLPAADLDYELEALGPHGVPAAAPTYLDGWRPSFPDRANISGTVPIPPLAHERFRNLK